MKIFQLFKKSNAEPNCSDMKYLIAGLGNIGAEYEDTRHNVGFKVLDRLMEKSEKAFIDGRHAFVGEYRFKGRILKLIKPTTYMNLSGKAINYWLQKEKIPIENLLVIADDIALPFGALRMRPKGGDAGHNGLIHIIDTLGTSQFTRLRFGIGNDFHPGGQVDYVLGKWEEHERAAIDERLDQAVKFIKGFVTVGVGRTMTDLNNK
jgi:peptidyl-tRNA hydrolase, PTH1 family